jgi:hypothetical protein
MRVRLSSRSTASLTFTGCIGGQSNYFAF